MQSWAGQLVLMIEDEDGPEEHLGAHRGTVPNSTAHLRCLTENRHLEEERSIEHIEVALPENICQVLGRWTVWVRGSLCWGKTLEDT